MIDPFRSWLDAQARFDALRARLTPGPMADLAYANAWGGPGARFEQVVADALGDSSALQLQYTPYGGSRVARRVVADDLGPSLGGDYDWRDVALTPGAMSGLHVTLRSLLPRDGSRPNVIIPTPCWIDHPLYAADLGYEVRLLPRDPDTLELRASALAPVVDKNTRALLMAQPCNPTGRVHDAEMLQELSQVLGDRWWISDECHRDYAESVSPATFHANTAVVYSYGKRWGAQGQRVGAVLSKKRALTDAVIRNMRVGGYGMPTALMQRALPSLIDVRPNLERLSTRRERTIAALSPKFQIAPSHGTFFVAFKVADDWAFTESLIKRRVLVLPGTLFHSPGWIRLSLSAEDAMIDRAITAILEEHP